MASETTVIREHPAATIKNWSLKLSTAPVDDAPEIGNSPQSLTSRTVSLFEQAKENAVRLLNRTWQKRHVRWDDQEWDVLEYHSNAYDTQSLMVSCGTVTMDKPESADRRVLLIWNKKTRAWQLPKGRKNIHEDFAAAAMRETAEETGVAVQPLYLRFGTRLTLPERAEDETTLKLRRRNANSLLKSGGVVDDGIVNLLNKDIFCISQYPDPATGAMRHIYWYAARPLKGTLPDSSLLGQEDASVMTAQWFSAAEAFSRLKMSVERKAVALAVHYAEEMTEEEWKYSLEL